MSEALNVIKAHFGALREVTTAPVWQYDYGKKLEIDGIPNLPSTFEIHYSNSKARGTAKRWIGYDGVVDVLNEYLLSGADIWGFIFLHEGEDDGQTEYVIHIPVKERSEAEDSEPTPVHRDIVDEAIAALNTGVTQAGAFAASASESAEAAAQSADEAEDWAHAAEQSADAAGYAKFDIDDSDGQMYVTVANNLNNDLTFSIDESTGNLEVIIR